MDLLRKIGLACRNHYEKILLTLVLLILGSAVLYLNDQRVKEEEKMRQFMAGVNRRSGGKVKPIDISEFQAAIKRAENPPSLNFSLPHNLLNPVKWQRRPNNELVKIQTGKEVGWDQMVITRITPLNFTISLDKVHSAGGYFQIGLTRDAAERPLDRKKKPITATLNTTNRFFDKFLVVRDVKGPPDNPELLLELVDTNEKVTFSKDKPYVKVEGYEADLKYSLDGKTFTNLRVGSSLRFSGEDYKIVAITPNEVVASAQLNDRKYTVRQTASANP